MGANYTFLCNEDDKKTKPCIIKNQDKAYFDKSCQVY